MPINDVTYTSAFLIVDKPLEWLSREIYSTFEYTRSSCPELSQKIQKQSTKAFECLKQKNYTESRTHFTAALTSTSKFLYPPIKLSAMIVAGTAIAPLALLATPFTLLADITQGALEAAYAFKEGSSNAQALQILKMKCVASTVQHCSFFALYALVSYIPISETSLSRYLFTIVHNLSSCYLGLMVGAIVLTIATPIFHLRKTHHRQTCLFFGDVLAGLPFYRCSKLITVNCLPAWAHPNGFIIFHDNPEVHSLWIEKRWNLLVKNLKEAGRG